MSASSDDDAVREFANALREQFGSSGSIAEMIKSNAATTDRRRRERKPFISEGLIALWNGTDSPERLEYRCVPFRDISTTGLSFWLDKDPTT